MKFIETICAASAIVSGGSAAPQFSNASNAPVVDLGYAKYQGHTNIHGVREFLGMRYAAPPLGNLRYRAPRAPPQSKGITKADKHAPTCLQVGSPADNGDSVGVPFDDLPRAKQAEDCLYVDVYTPKGATANSKLPVMLHIPGGGYSQISDANWNGTALINSADNEMIFVLFSYRVGHFGFLASEEVRAHGDLNAGLLDQRMAMQWVKQHIATFGGDPNHVVLNGDSAGAGSIAIHMIAYGGAPTDLFAGAMMESVFFPRQPAVPELESQYQHYLNATGCADIACLRRAKTSVLQKANVAQPPYDGRRMPSVWPFTPVTDGDLIRSELYTAFQQGKYINVPVLIGDTSNEGTIFVPMVNTSRQMDNFMRDNFPKLSNADIKTMNQLYPVGFQQQSQSITKFFSALAGAYGEATFTCAGNFIAETINKTSPSRIWNYRYNVRDPFLIESGYGVPHVFEVVGVFGPYGASVPINGSSYLTFNKNIIPITMGYWSSFVRTLNPNKLRARGSPVWGVFGESNRLKLQTNATKMEVIPQAQDKRCDFWNRIGAAIEQ